MTQDYYADNYYVTWKTHWGLSAEKDFLNCLGCWSLSSAPRRKLLQGYIKGTSLREKAAPWKQEAVNHARLLLQGER